MKTLAIRLEDDVHAQLTVLAQLEEQTVTDAIRSAIESYIEAKKARPEVSARAEAVLADIEREAAVRRSAIAALFGSPRPAAAEEPAEPSGQEPRPRNPRSKGGGGSATS